MKIVLAVLNAKYVHSNLAVYDLAAYAKKKWNTEGMAFAQEEGKAKPEIAVKEYTINHNLDQILQSLYKEKAAVVAFSCYIWNYQEIRTIARELHKVSPAVRIWFGGPEVSYDSEKVLQENPFLEGVVCGEGEETFYELTKLWWSCEASEPDYSSVLGVTYKGGKNPPRPLLSMDDIPFIYEDLSEFEHKILYYETSRGCPFSCSYCLSSIDKTVRFRSMSLVERELQFFLEHRVSQVKFIDRTFNCKREHALAIWNYIADHDNGVTNFHFEVAADLIGEAELAVLERMRPGLVQLEIGLQSTHPDTIKEIRRVMNIDALKRNMQAIHSFHNIHQHLDLIAGLPYEDFETFKQSFCDAYEMKPDQLQLGFLKVLKGSFMEEQVSAYALCFQEQQPYEVLSTKWITYDEILALKRVEEMVEVYYNSHQFYHVLSYLVPLFDTPYAFFDAIGSYYEEQELSGIGFRREARYEVLRDFCLIWLKDDERFSSSVLEELMTVDYYLRENAKVRPSWSKEEPIDKTSYHEFFKKGGTEEVSLLREGYESKVAARAMHIEPVSRESVAFLSDLFVYDNEDREQIARVQNGGCYLLYDYEKCNPLTHSAKVTVLQHL